MTSKLQMYPNPSRHYKDEPITTVKRNFIYFLHIKTYFVFFYMSYLNFTEPVVICKPTKTGIQL